MTPPRELLDDCVHCGFCLPTCPTYRLWGEEMDSPRGRIHLMRIASQEGEGYSEEVVERLDNCLGCMACVTACPSGVRYDLLLQAARFELEAGAPRTRRERAFRRALLGLLTRPRALRALAPLTALGERLGLARRVAASPLLERAPRLRALLRLAPPVDMRAAMGRLPRSTPARGARRGVVGLLQGCVQRVFFARVNEATAQVLAAEGFDVHAPSTPRCCGALPAHAGVEGPALALARETIAAFEGCDTVVVNAAGCGSAMKEYGHRLRDDPAWAERAARFSARVVDVSELLARTAPRATRRPLPLTVAYHDACHLAHAQAIVEEPRALLRAIPELELREPADPEICCGSAGVYNLLHPEPAGELGRAKAERILATGAAAVAAANPGCAMQIGVHAQELGGSLAIYHPVELLRMSIEGLDAPAHEPRRQVKES